MSRRGLLLALAAPALALSLGACGKKGPPEAPEGSTYPRTYPQPASQIYEGDLLAPTKSKQEGGDVRNDIRAFPEDRDFPTEETFDDEDGVEGADEGGDEGGAQ